MLTDPESRLEDELRHHIQERADHLVSDGWDPDAAWAEARRRFGDVDGVRRELKGINRRAQRPYLISIATNLRYAGRWMLAHPLFTASVTATLALGIGAATSVFAVADALLIRALPYDNADRWVNVRQVDESGRPTAPLSRDRFAAWRDASAGVADEWTANGWTALARSDGDRAETLDILVVTPNAPRLLGAPLLLGRGFADDESAPGSPAVGLISERYWARSGADAGILGTSLRVEGAPVTIVGVVADGWKFPPAGRDIDLWLPLREDFTFLDRRVGGFNGTWARLTDGLTISAAQERLDRLAQGLDDQNPDDDTWRIELSPVGADRARPQVRQAVVLLAWTVAVLFLIALVNGVNLLIVRTWARTRELAIRLAMGASRRQLIGQLTTEGVVLGLVSGGAAVLVAILVVRVLGSFVPETVVYGSPHVLAMEGRALFFAFSAALGTGTVLGLIPAFGIVGQSGTHGVLAGRSGDDPPKRRSLRTALVVIQVGLSMSLLVVAGVLVHSVVRLTAVEPGFSSDEIVIADLQPSPRRYPTNGERADFARRLESALEARPEVQQVALSTIRRGSEGPLEGEGTPVLGGGPRVVPHASVSPDYISTMGLTLVEGRGLEEGDVGSPNVVVDRDLAQLLWTGESALGRRFRLGEGQWMTVVGVVEELMLLGRDQRDGPYQFLSPRDPDETAPYLEVLIRTNGPPEIAIAAFQGTLHQLDPQQSYFRARSASDWLSGGDEEPRFVAALVGLMASVALVLAAVGLFGLLAYSVTQRTRELAVRVALGADPLDLTSMVVREGLGVAGLGVLLGLGMALVFVRLVEGLLYDVAPLDPMTLVLAPVAFLCVSVLASLLPARAATRVTPVQALKST